MDRKKQYIWEQIYCSQIYCFRYIAIEMGPVPSEESGPSLSEESGPPSRRSQGPLSRWSRTFSFSVTIPTAFGMIIAVFFFVMFFTTETGILIWTFTNTWSCYGTDWGFKHRLTPDVSPRSANYDLFKENNFVMNNLNYNYVIHNHCTKMSVTQSICK